MTDSATGVAFVVLAVGGAYYLSQSTKQLSKVDIMSAEKKNVVSSRASNASRSSIQGTSVFEAEAPSLIGKFGPGRLMERVVSTRLAQSWRDAEMPIMASMRRHSNAPLDLMLARVQAGVKSVYDQTLGKTAYILDGERERPVIQGKIRQKFQIANFL
ncbi:MAG: hypothetical protein JSR46_03015 [Verrucomicrobia bacterium]|nr:hypothetical protein [Verrucomicrobiota bacterium]